VSRASIIIPVRNDVPRLTKLLGSFSPKDWEDHEVLVIDDCSTDDTPRVAAGFPARVVSLERRCGPSVARNHGARMAHEDVLVFADSDVVLEPGAIARLTGWMDDPSVIGVSTIASETPENPGFIAKYCAVTDKYVCDNWGASRPADTALGNVPTCRWFSSRLGAIRKDAFMELGEFDTGYDRPCIEDAEFSSRLARRYSLVMDHGVEHTHHWPAELSVVLHRVFINSRLLMMVVRKEDHPDAGVMPLSEKAGRILSGLAVLLLPTAPFSMPGALASAGCFAISAWIYRALFAMYYRAGGLFFMLGSAVLHYLTTCVGLAGAASALIMPPRKKKIEADQR
jgi:glycosyltransferase involved in cell wall biosynthesis